LGKSFLRYWIDKPSDKRSTFFSFCDYIEKNDVPVKIIKNKILSFELVSEDIDIRLLKTLDESRLYEYIV